jgi:tellurite resistance protein
VLDATRQKNTSFRRYSGHFLALLAAQGLDDALTDEWLAAPLMWDEETLAVALALMKKRGVRLSAKFAFIVAELSPNTTKGVVLRRVGDRFRELFDRRYGQEFHAGPSLDAMQRHHVFHYKAASSALGEFEQSVDGVLQLQSQFKPIIELWNRCVDDLRSLSRLDLAAAVTTPAQWEALPHELRENTDHPLAARVRDLVREGVGQAAATLVSAGALAEVCGFAIRSKLTATQSRSLAQTVEHCGFWIEPDARITSQAYAWDGRVAVFSADIEGVAPSSQYLAASRLFRLGVAVASADGAASEEEFTRLGSEIEDAFHLEERDRRRMAALRTVLLNSSPERVALARKVIEAMTHDARLAVGRLLVVVAVADGVVTRDELRILRQGFRQLGLPPEELEKTIAQLLPAQASDLVPVAQGAKPPTGETIPPPPDEGLRLDRGAIHSILAETEEVAQLLADAMEVDEDAEPTSAQAPTMRAAETVSLETRPTELPTRYRAFLSDLNGRERWTRAEAETLARKHGQMLDGAIEALNDWSIETRGTSLVDEDGDDLVVART